MRRNSFQMVAALALSAASTQAQEPTPIRCPAAPAAVIVDGDLGEWSLEAADWHALPGSSSETAQKDASAEAALRFDDDALYLALRVQDEQRVADTPNFWDADAIDLYFEGGAAAATGGATGDRTRLLLLPFNAGRRFGVITWRGKQVLGAGGLTGVEVVAREVAVGSGAYVVEARVPWRPLRIDPRGDAPVRFDLALRDRDSGEKAEGDFPAARATLAWSGVVDRTRDDPPLPRLRFEGEPRSPQATSRFPTSGLGLGAALAILLLSWLVGKSAKRAQHVLQRRLPRWRLYGLFVLCGGALLLAFGVDVAELLATWRAEARLRERGAQVAAAFSELELAEVAARLRGADDTTLRDLLDGRELPIPESNRFEQVALLGPDERGPGDYRSLEPIAGVPFSEYGVRLGNARGAVDSSELLDVVLESPQPVRRVHLAMAALLPDAARAGAGQIVDAVELQLRFVQRGAAASAQVQRFTIDDARSDPIGHQERTWGRARLRAGPREEPWLAAELAGQELRHVDHFVVEVTPPAGALESEATLQRLTLVPTRAAAGATLWVSGITLELAGPAPRYVPLALGSSDRNGFPMPMRAGRPAPREVRLLAKGGNEPTRALLWGKPGQPPLELKRLRLYYRAEGPVLRAMADAANLRVRAWVLVTVEGEAEPRRIPLRAGLEIDDAQLYEPQHPASMTSFLATTFETRQGLLHYDGYELPLAPADRAAPPLRVAKVEIEQPAESRGALIVAGMSALVQDEPPPPPRLAALVVAGGKLALAPEIRAALTDASLPLSFAVARGGVVRQVGGAMPAGDAQRLLGTGIAAGDGSAVRRERRIGRSLLTLPLPCTLGSTRYEVLLSCARPELAQLRSARTAAAWILGLLALPFLLLLLVDALARIARVRTRLSFLFLLTSLAPLLVLFAVLANLLASEQRRAEERRAGELIGLLRERLTRLCALADELAARTLRDFEGSEILTARVSDDEVRRHLRQMAQAFPDPDATVAVVVEAPSDAGAARRIHSGELVAADPRFDASQEGLALAWGEVIFSGSASNARRGFKVRVAGRVDVAALAAVRGSAEEGEVVALLAPHVRREGVEVEGGEPIAATGPLPLDGGAKRAAARELDAGRGAFFEPLAGGGTCGFDLLRGSSGDPVAIVAAALGARPVRVRIGALDVDLSWFVLALGAVILAASHFLGSVVTEGITRPLARVLRGALERIEGSGLARRSTGGPRDDSEDEVASLETSFQQLWDELARRGSQQALLVELIAAMAQPGELADRAQRALRFVRQLLGGEALGCWLLDLADDRLVLAAELCEARPVGWPARLDLPEAREWLRERKALSLASEVQAPAVAAALGGGAARLLLLPLELGARSIGLIAVRHREAADPLAAHDPALVSGVLGQVAAGIERARLETRSIEDAETGLFVHAHFVARLNEEIDRAAHNDRPLAMVLLRVDPDGGVAALRREELRRVASACARELRRACREREIVGRAAALEFEVVAPYGGRSRADELVNDLRQRLADPQSLGADLAARLRFAVAEFPGDARSVDFLFALLQRRLEASAAIDTAPPATETIERFRQRFPEFGFGSGRMEVLLRQLEKVAASDASVLLLGETGTGKEVAAQLLHRIGPRANGPFVAVHCGALPENLLEAELFGHEKGAFTGADQRRLGRFEIARGGTLFLDEVGEIPLTVQVKLLRVLQERKVQRLGSGEEVPVDVRVVTATHQSLERLVAQGAFREDLFYRLKVVTLELPPLRERLDEIPQLVDRFLQMRRQADPTCRVRGIEPAALDVLARHHWPGNVRELRNVIERAVVLGDGELVRRDDLEFVQLPSGGRAIEAAPPAVGGASAPLVPVAPAALPGNAAGGGRGDGAGAEVPVAPSVAADRVQRNFTPRQLRLLAIAEQHGGIVTSREYCQQEGLSQRTALRDLRDLVDLGVLERVGARRGASYRLVQTGR
ncbi:MAG: sigma 54-interacting transcriptional regulator [Planctomycetes bacterium]|nr:sigma 54-interacting transcriptional regulator [Planctomycetota bacterium]